MRSKRVWISSPRRTPPALLERTLALDGELVDRLIAQIEVSATASTKHYNVIVGPRGSGKSHCLAVVARRCEKQRRDDLAIAWLPDDPAELASELHLFEAILRALGVAVELPRGDRDAALGMARARLREALGERTLLLCIESLDAVLAALGESGQQGLRAFLQEERCCTVLATANRITRDLSSQGRPFYGFFAVHRLLELDVRGVTRLLKAHARARGDTDLVRALGRPAHRAVLRALHHILGGRPVHYVDLVRGAMELAEPESILLRGLDEHASREQDRRLRLSRQQRLILAWLTRRRSAAQVKQVAHGCFVTEQTVSPQLRALREAGFVTSERIGRETWYELADPLAGLEPAYAAVLLEFVVAWFTDREAALRWTSPIAARLRETLPRVDDARQLLALPRLERSLVVAESAATAGEAGKAGEAGEAGEL